MTTNFKNLQCTFWISGISTTLIIPIFGLPALAGNFSLAGSNDIYLTNFNGTSEVVITGAQLGIAANEGLEALSGGQDPLKSQLWDILITPDRPSVGKAGSSVNFFQPESPADIFFTNPTLQGTNRTLARANQIGIAPTENIDALEIFGATESTMSNLQLGDNIYFSVGTSDIFLSTSNGIRNVFASNNSLGLVNGDVIDGIAVLDDGVVGQAEASLDRVLFSLAPRSPTLANLNRSPGDIFFSDLDNGNPIIAGPANISFAFDLTADNLGLLATDNLNGFDVVATSTFLNIPQDPNFPVDQTVIPTKTPEPTAILSLLTIAVLGFFQSINIQLKRQ